MQRGYSTLPEDVAHTHDLLLLLRGKSGDGSRRGNIRPGVEQGDDLPVVWM